MADRDRERELENLSLGKPSLFLRRRERGPRTSTDRRPRLTTVTDEQPAACEQPVRRHR